MMAQIVSEARTNSDVFCELSNVTKRAVHTLAAMEKMTLEKMQKVAKDIQNMREESLAIRACLKKEEDLIVRRRIEKLQLAGYMRVYSKCRPFFPSEEDDEEVVDMEEDPSEISIIDEGGLTEKKTFTLDAHYPVDVSQQEFFETFIPLIEKVLSGFSLCLFAFGQTGSGKTFTMLGTSDNPGLVFRTLNYIFRWGIKNKEHKDVGVEMTIVEIYNEQVKDLLAYLEEDEYDQPAQFVTQERRYKPIAYNKTKTSSVQGKEHVYQEGVTKVPVTAAGEAAMNQIYDAIARRRSSATDYNFESSRSHLIITYYLTVTDKDSGYKVMNKLNLIDLAGSERISRTGANGVHLSEAKFINKSLTALVDVITAIRSCSPYIPFRSSQLTHFLKESLLGNSLISMIANISPGRSTMFETLSTLQFAQSCYNTQMGPPIQSLTTKENLEAIALVCPMDALHPKKAEDDQEAEAKFEEAAANASLRKSLAKPLPRSVEASVNRLFTVKVNEELISKRQSVAANREKQLLSKSYVGKRDSFIAQSASMEEEEPNPKPKKDHCSKPQKSNPKRLANEIDNEDAEPIGKPTLSKIARNPAEEEDQDEYEEGEEGEGYEEEEGEEEEEPEE